MSASWSKAKGEPKDGAGQLLSRRAPQQTPEYVSSQMPTPQAGASRQAMSFSHANSVVPGSAASTLGPGPVSPSPLRAVPRIPIACGSCGHKLSTRPCQSRLQSCGAGCGVQTLLPAGSSGFSFPSGYCTGTGGLWRGCAAASLICFVWTLSYWSKN